MYSAVSSGERLRKLHASSSERTGPNEVSAVNRGNSLTCMHTFQSLDSPCLKLLERDLGRRWPDIEIQLVVIGLLLELCIRKLPLLVVEISSSFWIDPRVIVADHDLGMSCQWCCDTLVSGKRC